MDLLTLLWVLGYFSLTLSIIYKFFVWEFDYFLEQGIPGPKALPVFGSYWKIWTKRWHEVELERYEKYGKIYGTFDGRTPNLTIGDPKVYQKILIQDFENFRDRRKVGLNGEYLKRMLTTLNGQKWKELRNCLNPAFTTSRITAMTKLMDESGIELVELVNQKINSGTKKIDMKRIAAAFTLDVIANCTFGTKLDCLTNPNSEFLQRALNLFCNEGNNNSAAFVIKHMLYKNVRKFLPGSTFDGFDFFAILAKNSLKERRRSYKNKPNDTKRGDFLDLLLESTGSESYLQNEAYLIAQILQFLVGGFEPTFITIACVINSLALNQEIQNKLRQEIREATQNRTTQRDVISSLPYLNQCVDEALRMYGPALKVERRCNATKNYEGIKIRKGLIVNIPIYAIHHDSKIYPNPEIFNPERFSSEEKSKRDPMTYIPFGEGNRNCIGSKFALEQIKVGLAHLINDFRFYRVFETSDPPQFASGGFPMLQPLNVIVGIDKV